MAAKYPKCTVTGISNSNSQREAIMKMAQERGLNNVRILTGKKS
jgi:cyclopropane-fatty-acyl-phospholipid synthase